MIRLEQIRLLENKINKAVKLIEMLREENSALKNSIDGAQKRMQELEELIGEFKTGQEEIEKAILRAMKNLDRLEDEVVASPHGSPPEDTPVSSGEPKQGPPDHADSPGPSELRPTTSGSRKREVAREPQEPPSESPTEEGKKQELDIF